MALIPNVVTDGNSVKFSLKSLVDSDFKKNIFTNAVVSTVMMTTIVVGPFYLAKALNLEVVTVGLVMSVGPLTSLMTGFLSGLSVDRMGSAKMAATGLGIMLIGTLAFAFVTVAFGMWGFVLSAAILSTGYQLFLAANGTEVMSRVGGKSRGLASGMLGLSRNLGLIAGTSLMGAVFAAFGIRFVFLLAGGLIALMFWVNLKFK
jgi:MFS family permease